MSVTILKLPNFLKHIIDNIETSDYDQKDLTEKQVK